MTYCCPRRSQGGPKSRTIIQNEVTRISHLSPLFCDTPIFASQPRRTFSPDFSGLGSTTVWAQVGGGGSACSLFSIPATLWGRWAAACPAIPGMPAHCALRRRIETGRGRFGTTAGVLPSRKCVAGSITPSLHKEKNKFFVPFKKELRKRRRLPHFVATQKNCHTNCHTF